MAKARSKTIGGSGASTPPATGEPRADAVALRVLARAGRYVRKPASDRAEEGTSVYKKGWELRFVVKTSAEMPKVQRAVKANGFTPGKGFEKANQYVVPVYGRAAVLFFEKHLNGLSSGR